MLCHHHRIVVINRRLFNGCRVLRRITNRAVPRVVSCVCCVVSCVVEFIVSSSTVSVSNGTMCCDASRIVPSRVSYRVRSCVASCRVLLGLGFLVVVLLCRAVLRAAVANPNDS